MNKIGLFAFYFGKFPSHMPVWIKTCAANPTIDWFLITDQQIDFPLPDNIKLTRTDIGALTGLFSEKLGLKANLYRPYKLCDFRPAYGLIYEEMLKGYDFWGYSDFDVVFGDIRAKLSEDILDSHDKIQPFGHLTFYRNCEKINTLFREQCEGVADYRDVFVSDTHYAFDEFRGIDKICEIKGIKRYRNTDIFVETYIFRSKFVDKNTEIEDAVYYWENGKLYMSYPHDGRILTKEIIYIHLRNRRMKMPRFDILEAEAFFVVPNTFKPKGAGILTQRDMETKNRPILTYGPIQWKYDKYIKRPVKQYLNKVRSR